MRCPKCNSLLDDNEKFCKYCGEKIKNNKDDHNDDHDVQFNYSSNSYSKDLKDKNFREAYLKNEYDTFDKQVFNVFAFLWAGPYLAYRRMYLISFLYVVIHTAAFFLVDVADIFIFIILLAPVVIGFAFKPLYMFSIDQRAKRLQKKYSNKTDNEIKDILDKMDPRNPLAIGIYYALHVAAFIALVFILAIYFLITDYDYQDILSPNKVTENLEFTIPERWEKSEQYNDWEIDYFDPDNNCTFNIYMYDNDDYGFEVAENILKQDVYYNYGSTTSDTGIVNINGKDWTYLKVTNEDGVENHYYAIIEDKEAYIITFDVGEDKNICNKHKDTFINSLKFKDKTESNA